MHTIEIIIVVIFIISISLEIMNVGCRDPPKQEDRFPVFLYLHCPVRNFSPSTFQFSSAVTILLGCFFNIYNHFFQCKEIEKNNRMGKARDLFKIIRDTRGIFHAKVGTIKDRNGVDLTEAEGIKDRWQECTEELYKKDLHDPDNHNGEITHLESDILECEVKWALGSITTDKAIGGDGIPAELLQILKHDAVKVLHSICQQIWKTQ